MIYDPTGVNYVMNTLQAASYLGVSSDVIDDMVSKRAIPTSIENLRDDLPSLGFHGHKAG